MDETELFRVLASADRQILLHELANREKKVTEEELSQQVAARRNQLPPEQVSEAKIENAHTRLYHVHFPLLSDLGLIDRDNGEIALTDDNYRDQLFSAAEALEEWPPDDLTHHSSA